MSTVTPSTTLALPLPTTAPPYIHYIPSKESNIHLEFNYPSSWTFGEEIQDADFMIIGFGDPRFRTLPAPSSDDFHPTPNDFGRVSIWITPSELSQSPDAQLESLKQSYNETSWMTVLDSYKTMIDGYEASALEYQIKPAEDYTSLMFNRRILFMVKDQIYEIYFIVAEKDRGSEFEQGYEYFFNSLKIVP